MEYGRVLLWWLAFEALAVAGLFVATAVFPRRGDRGAALALPLALAVVWLPVYWLGHVAFGPLTVAAGVGVLVAAAAVAYRYGAADRVDWRAHARSMAVFTAAFLFLVAVRAVDPAVHPIAGEKFLDFGLLKALLRPGALPPEDIWFAGEPVQYYYGGHLLAATLATLTGTAGRYAYNLALAGVYATLVTAAYAVAAELADRAGGGRVFGGLLGAFFVGFAANLVTGARLLAGALPAGVQSTVAGWVGLSPDRVAISPSEFFYWDASRVIPGTINEFPLFAFLNGDLHAHMTSTPFLLLAAGLLAAYYRTPEEGTWRRRALVLGGVPAVAGMLAVVNTWSFPTVAGLSLLALALAPASPATLLPASVARPAGAVAGRSRAHREVVRLAAATALAATVGLVGLLWAAPFFLGPASGRSLATFPALPSSLGALLAVHGAFVAVFVTYLAGRAASGALAAREVAGAAAGVAAVTAAGLVVVARLVGHTGPIGFAGVALFAPLVVAAWLLARFDGDVGYEAVLIAAGAGLALLVEVAYVREQAGPGRLNTVFKTYMQIWVLWGTAAGGTLAALVDAPARSLAVLDPDRLTGHGHATDGGEAGLARRLSAAPVGRATATAALAALVVVATATYGGLAASSHFEGSPDATLDATAFVESSHAGEAAAIDWLDDRPGRPTIVASPSDGCRAYRWGIYDCDGDGTADVYSGGNAPSSLTGLPTVAGWSHEVGYRGPEDYFRRVAEVREMYTAGPARQAELLRKYGVDYVYVGPAERYRYGEVSFEGVPAVGEPMQFGEVTIYPVNATASG